MTDLPPLLTVAEDNTLTGNLLAAVSDVDSTVFTTAIVGGSAHGTLNVNASGTLTY